MLRSIASYAYTNQKKSVEKSNIFLSRFGGSMQMEGWQNMIKKLK